MIKTWVIFLITAGSSAMTIQSFRVLVMEQKFQEIIKEYNEEDNATNKQDKSSMEGQGDINHQSSIYGHGIMDKQKGFPEQSGTNAQDKTRGKTLGNEKSISMDQNYINEGRQRQSVKHEQDKIGTMIKDAGHAVNCGPQERKMNFTWEPKIVYPKDSINMTLDMIAPFDFGIGEVCADIYVAGMTTPIFHYVKKVSCGMLELLFPGMCPKGKINKNDHVQGSRVLRSKEKIPLGTFTVVANITHEHNELFLCANMTVKVTTDTIDRTMKHLQFL